MAPTTMDHGTIGHGTIDGRENPDRFASLVILDARGRGLELTFWAEGDRCLHRLTAIDGARRECLLESVAGEADDPWPPGPPWQQVSATPGVDPPSPRQAGTRQPHAALLVGAAGASHWSASVERSDGSTLEGSGQSASPGLLFDIACRAKSRPDWLGSTYRIAGRVQAASSDMGSGKMFSRQSTLDLRTDLGEYQLRVLPLESTPADSCQSGSESSQLGSDSCQMTVSDGLVRIVAPPSWSDNQGPTTFRWRYQVSLVE